MKKYKITQVWKHTETLEVEAKSEAHALELAQEMDFEINHDDWLYSEEVTGCHSQRLQNEHST